MSSARERREKRRQRREALERAGQAVQQVGEERGWTFRMPQVPGMRVIAAIVGSIALILLVIFVLGRLTPSDTNRSGNAVWLDRSWSYGGRTAGEVTQMLDDLTANGIGTAYVYVSSLKNDGTWSGLPGGRDQFNEIEDTVVAFTQRVREDYPDLELVAWIEVIATTPAGYRLDNPQTQEVVATFSERMLERNGFDGVLLDVKPLFSENEDFITMLRTTRTRIGLDSQLVVAVPPDLTPTGTDLVLPEVIAPGTEWTQQYKQRIALQADEIVINAFNSYQTSPVAYIEWVTYQVNAYVEALDPIDSDTTIKVSVPNYVGALPAHDSSVESIASALDGVRRGVMTLDQEQAALITGVAIYTDRALSVSEWTIFQEKWLNPT